MQITAKGNQITNRLTAMLYTRGKRSGVFKAPKNRKHGIVTTLNVTELHV